MILIFNVSKDSKLNFIRRYFTNESIKTLLDSNMYIYFTPIRFMKEIWMITSGEFLIPFFQEEIKINYVELFIENGFSEKIKFDNYISINSQDYDPTKDYDCYYDEVTNLVMIRCSSNLFEKISSSSEYTSNEFNKINTKIYEFDNEVNIFNVIDPDKFILRDNFVKDSDIKIICYDGFIVENQLETDYWELEFCPSSFTTIKLIWEDILLNYPQVPIIKITSVFRSANVNEGCPFINDDKLWGIVMNKNLSTKVIKILPIFTIQLFLDKIKTNIKKYNLLNVHIKKISLDPRNEIGGLYISDDCYNITKSKNIDDKIETVQELVLKRNTIISSVDGYNIDTDGNLIINDSLGYPIRRIPFKSYLWFFKERYNDEYYNLNIEYVTGYPKIITISYDRVDTEFLKKNLLRKNKNINIKNYYPKGICITKLSYMNIKDKYIFELNETLWYYLKNTFINYDGVDKIYDHILKNRYYDKKILLAFELFWDDKKEFPNDHPTIRVVKKYNSIENLVDGKNNKEIKKIFSQI